MGYGEEAAVGTDRDTLVPTLWEGDCADTLALAAYETADLCAHESNDKEPLQNSETRYSELQRKQIVGEVCMVNTIDDESAAAGLTRVVIT